MSNKTDGIFYIAPVDAAALESEVARLTAERDALCVRVKAAEFEEGAYQDANRVLRGQRDNARALLRELAAAASEICAEIEPRFDGYPPVLEEEPMEKIGVKIRWQISIYRRLMPLIRRVDAEGDAR